MKGGAFSRSSQHHRSLTRAREGRMRRRKWRGHLRPAEQGQLWRRWRQGEALRAIARALDRRRKVVHRVLAGTGGFTPVPRRRSPPVLSVAEREEISRGGGGRAPL